MSMNSNDPFPQLIKAFAAAGAVYPFNTAALIAKAVKNRHMSIAEAVASVRQRFPGQFRDVRYLHPSTLPPQDDCGISPEAIRVGIELAMRELRSKQP